MANELIKCPECGAEFQISQAISHDIEITVSKKYEKQIKDLKEKSQQTIELKEKELEDQFDKKQKTIEERIKKQTEEKLKLEINDAKEQIAEKNKKLKELQSREMAIIKQQRGLEEKEKSFELDMARKLEVSENEIRKQFAEEKKLIENNAKKKAEEIYNIDINDLKEQIQEKTGQLKESKEQELALRKRQRELEEKEKNIELELSRKMDTEKRRILDEVSKDIADKHRLKDAEKEKQLSDMRKKIEELQRKAEQSSQQIQGEVLELELEELLGNEFPFDEIAPIAKGVKGGDILQIVKMQSGRVCGKILWETKRTKVWSDSWLQKLKDDQREAKADIPVLVSEALPPDFHHFKQISGVWVSDIPAAISLSFALRTVLLQVARTNVIQEGRKEKMEVVYNYLTGPEFRNRVEAIIESFSAMKTDLESEKRAMQKIWAKREKQIENVVSNTVGMHGDLQGIAGSSLPAIKMLELNSQESTEKN